jgi:hypothetical protein
MIFYSGCILQFVVVVILLPGTTNCSAQPTQKEELGVSLCVSVSLYYQFLQSKEEHREKVMVFEWTLFAEEEFLHSPLCPLAA